MTTALADVRKIAEKYFSDIVYIDDALKKPDDIMTELFKLGDELAVSAESPTEKGEEKIVSFRPRSGSMKKQVADHDNDGAESTGNVDLIRAHSKWVEYKKAFDLIYDFQKEGCKVSPFYYESGEDSFKAASSVVEKSHLTILDWELDERKGHTTISLLKSALGNKFRMKLIVIYTNNPSDAVNQISGEFNSKPEMKRLEKEKTVEFFQLNSSLILVCGKESFDAPQILNTFIDLLIEKFGLFPFVFFDAINKITNGTALILNRFSYPFENALMLQLQSSGLGEHDEYAAVVSGMVTNHINEIVRIDPKILDCIVNSWVTKVEELVHLNDEQLKRRIHTFLDDLVIKQNNNPAGDMNKDILENLKCLSEADWRVSLNKFSRQRKLFNPDADTKFSEFILKKLVEVIVQKRYEEIAVTFDEGTTGYAFEKLKAEFFTLSTASIRAKYKEPLFKLLPSLFVYLLSRESNPSELIRSQAELVRMMKLIPYQVSERTIRPEGKAVNYFKSGDILYGEGKFLVCISPSCDVFRPKKVDYKLKFMVGEKYSEDPTRKLKESEHLSILPDPESENELICVKWSCSQTLVLDIKEQLGEFRKYSRLYRFDSTYCQQIINKYIAYHSRAGVDELYIKDHSSSRNLFVFDRGELDQTQAEEKPKYRIFLRRRFSLTD